MNTVNLETWEECQLKLKEIAQYRNEMKKENSISSDISLMLYRGQGNKDWGLISTLERYDQAKVYLEDYYKTILNIKPQIETFTKSIWKISSLSEYEEWLDSADLLQMYKPKASEYMIYLRHHGFPSPLLDWTRSPFIAAYFAFHDITDGIHNVSIYVYIEDIGQGKWHRSREPRISQIDLNVKTHARHFLQQSGYTICTVKDNDKLSYACHEDVFLDTPEEQDLLWKINIPSSEKYKVLSQLDSMNINAFSLFGSEESLMETLALREFHLRERNS